MTAIKKSFCCQKQSLWLRGKTNFLSITMMYNPKCQSHQLHLPSPPPPPKKKIITSMLHKLVHTKNGASLGFFNTTTKHLTTNTTSRIIVRCLLYDVA